jgi:arylsulfatase A-like enzyme
MNTLTRREFSTALLAGAGLAATGCSEQQPNVLWITSEDNSPLLGCYGDAYATTPNLDKMAVEGILYENAHATYPVCAPARSSLITGMYPQSLGTGHMRSMNPLPDHVRMFPALLREAGYYCTNNSKQDYNTEAADDVWDESSQNATYRNRGDRQPFFHVRNFTTTHESSLFKQHRPRHDPARVALPAYHPDTPTFRSDWAQYYDHVERLDTQVGEVLGELAADGLADNTIVFYFSDHGGILPRTKRSIHESGTRVPLIVRFPEALRALAPDGPGRRTDRLVSFVDFAPSLLNLLEQKIPDYMQGMPFLGPETKARREYVYIARDRMGPSPNLQRAVRNERFRYVRNYLPQLAAAQLNAYEFGIPSWREIWQLYRSGALNKTQRLMFEPQPGEELFDTEADPHEVNNLAGQPEFEDTLRRLRGAHVEHTLRIRDTAFIPEIEMHRLTKATTPYEFAHDEAKYPLRQILKVVELGSQRDTTNLPVLARYLSDENTVVQYWAAIGCRLLEEEAEPAREELKQASVASSSDAVRMAAAEALCWIGEAEAGLRTLTEYLNDEREWVRFTAANHLGWLGPKALSAKEALELHLEQETERYPKLASEQALQLIEGKLTLPQ